VIYTISHTLSYRYDRPVQLAPHILRLHPRSDVSQTLIDSALQISPQPEKIIHNIDLDGNSLWNLWFAPTPLSGLQIQMQAKVETHRTNPFDFLLEKWAVQLPIDYPSSLRAQLNPYLTISSTTYSSGLDPQAVQLAQEVYQATNGNTVLFLGKLNQRIFEDCAYVIREMGDPFPPGITWMQKCGSCRDYAVLFMEVCRAVGLAARFVSGYHEGDPDTDDFHLHAWVEVYLPGAGWRGYDPTLGLAVGDRHIALAASPFPNYAAPLSGHLRAGSNAHATMSYQLSIINTE
jgi:transglutaminase-like putative cysteine protease